MTQYLAFNRNDPVRLAGATLPGVITDIEIDAELKLEKKHLEDKSGSVKLPHGFADATVTISLSILPPDAERQVKTLEAAFKKGEGVGRVTVYRIVNPFLDSRGITSVVFQRLNTKQGSEDEEILCTLTLVEYEPVVTTTEQVSTPTRSGPASGVGANAGPGGGAGGGGASASPEARGLAGGVLTAERAASFIPDSLGLPSNGGQ